MCSTLRRSHLLATLLALGAVAAAGCSNEHQTPVGPDIQSSVSASATPLAFTQVKAGRDHSCGLTTDHLIYCWGRNQGGQIGDGTTTDRFTPVPVVGGLHFIAVATGAYNSCGITTANRLFCWGWNSHGQSGTGSSAYGIVVPTLVKGGLRWRAVATGGEYTCAITTDDRAFCWGLNQYGQLGTNDLHQHSLPVAVVGGRLWRQIGAAYSATCGVTTANKGYCWGRNLRGEIGDGTLLLRKAPTAVRGGLLFLQIHPGQLHSCGLTTLNRAYCWGDDGEGELGNGPTQTEPSLVPSRVSGGLLFRQLSVAAGKVSCGTTIDNKAYCWGNNGAGQIGDGTGINRPAPQAVAGGLLFQLVNTGGIHSCGVTTTHKAYCWGYNASGALGTGNEEGSLVPVLVSGQM
jgi:Regulator of chromosome condensation (RCC1) repeat